MIKISGLVKKFGDFTALGGITLEIEKGQVYGLVGSNGSGKSTLLRILSGVYQTDGGEVTIDGESVFDNAALKSRLFFVGDTPCFFLHSNLMDMAKFYSRMYPNFSYERLEEMNKVFPIDKKGKLQNMSKGMQRQAALILAFACCPEYLFLDEAFDGLDPVMREALRGLIAREIDEREMTVIIASHNLRELEDLCDSVGLIHLSELVFSKAIYEIKTDVHKIQVAFNSLPETAVFEQLDLLKIDRTGSLLQLIVKGDVEQIKGFIKKLEPIFMEQMPLTLEEVFIYELGGLGYDVNQIIA